MVQQFVAIGEAMLELSSMGDHNYRLNYAGDTFNVCYYLSHFSKKIKTDVHFATALGDDQYSREMMETWESLNINTDYVMKIPKKLPGLYLIQIDPNGERHFHYYRKQSAATELFNHKFNIQKLSELRQFKYFYFSGISLAILDSIAQQRLLKLAQTARSNNCTIIFDPNYRSALWPNPENARNVIDQALSLTHIALPTFSDEALLHDDSTPEDTIRRLSEKGIREIVVKNGDRDCLIHHSGKTIKITPPVQHNVVDTTAAGDSFNAGYLAARFAGKSPQQAAVCAHHLASTVIGTMGALLPPDEIPDILS